MKRFHVHLHVQNLPMNIDFYSKMFGAEPARVESDYVKWMLADPPLNFAISTRGSRSGVDPPASRPTAAPYCTPSASRDKVS